jgi:hypothetical protein
VELAATRQDKYGTTQTGRRSSLTTCRARQSKASEVEPRIISALARGEMPILVRRDGERFVLVHGLHRLEARKALGEESVFGYLVQAQKR